MSDFEDRLREMVRESIAWETPEGMALALRKIADEIETDPDGVGAAQDRGRD